MWCVGPLDSITVTPSPSFALFGAVAKTPTCSLHLHYPSRPLRALPTFTLANPKSYSKRALSFRCSAGTSLALFSIVFCWLVLLLLSLICVWMNVVEEIEADFTVVLRLSYVGFVSFG